MVFAARSTNHARELNFPLARILRILQTQAGEGTTLSKSEEKTKSLGEAIDEIINALTGLSESARRTAIRAASEHLKIQVNSESVSATIEDAKPSVLDEPRASQTRSVDIRTFKEEKQPSSAMEMAATVAY